MDPHDKVLHLQSLVNESLEADDLRDIAAHRAIGRLFTNWRQAMTDGSGYTMTELADRDIPLVIESLQKFHQRVVDLDASLAATETSAPGR